MIQNAERSVSKHLELHKPELDWDTLSTKDRLGLMLNDSNQIYAIAMLKDLTSQIVAKIEATPPRRSKPPLDDASPGSPEKAESPTSTPIIKRPRGRPAKRSLASIGDLDDLHGLDGEGAVSATGTSSGADSDGQHDEHQQRQQQQQQQQQQQHLASDGTAEGSTMVIEMSGTATPPPKRRRMTHSLTPSSAKQAVVDQSMIERIDRWFEQLLQREQHFHEERLKADERDREERRRIEERDREERHAAIERQTAILTAFLTAVLSPAQKAALTAEINSMPEEVAISPVVTALLSVPTAPNTTEEQLQQQ